MQDAYSLRCTPQVHGAARDTLAHAEHVAERELASAIDNPMILPDGRVESCGNFHGAPLGFACDFLAIAVAELGGDRRAAHRPPARRRPLARPAAVPRRPTPGVNSGLMIAHYTQAAMAPRTGGWRCRPASTRCRPSAMQEDHVSMGWAAARKLRRSVANLRRILAVELACAAAASTCAPRCSRRPAPARRSHVLRERVAGPGPDRWLSPELAPPKQLLADGSVLDAVEAAIGPLEVL